MKIVSVVRRRNVVEIHLDSGDVFTLAKKIWEQSEFRQGSEISEQNLKQLLNESELFSIKAASLRILARREHSKSELIQKLKQRGFSEQNIDKVISILEQDNFINDERFAELYFRSNFEIKKKSPKKIAYELSKKGVDNSFITNNLNEINEDDIYNNALQIALKKIRTINTKDTEKLLYSVRNHLLYKAFDMEIVNRVLTELKERLGA